MLVSRVASGRVGLALTVARPAAQIPHMRAFPGPRSVLLIDNCRIHNPRELRERVRKVGGRLIFLEPYDPQHMPIEVGFRAMKRRGAACRVVPCALASVLPSAGRSAPCPVPPSSTHRVWPCHSQVDAQEPRAHPRHAALPADPARGEVRHARGGTSGLRSVRVLKRAFGYCV